MATIMKSFRGDDRLRRDRKYTAFWAVFLMASVMAFMNKLAGTEYVQLVTFVFGLYMAGNGFEHASSAWQARGESRPSESGSR